MNRCMTFGLTPLVLFLLSSSLVSCMDTGLRSEETSQLQFDTPIAPQHEPRPNQPAFTQPELDQMLAPIALYPDALLSQILMASTYPMEVIKAARWSKANPTLKGEQAVQAVAQQTWDQSIKSLVAFPASPDRHGRPIAMDGTARRCLPRTAATSHGDRPKSAAEGVCSRQPELE